MKEWECTNPSKPCHLHDPRNEWRIEWTRRHTIDARWLAWSLVVIYILTLVVWW